jgi:hypothetical protein
MLRKTTTVLRVAGWSVPICECDRPNGSDISVPVPKPHVMTASGTKLTVL